MLSQYGNGHRAEIEFPGMSEPEVITHFLLMQNLINSKFILIFNILAIFPRILFFNMAHFLIFLQILIFNMAHWLFSVFNPVAQLCCTTKINYSQENGKSRQSRKIKKQMRNVSVMSSHCIASHAQGKSQELMVKTDESANIFYILNWSGTPFA